METLRPDTVWIKGICYRKAYQPIDEDNFNENGDTIDEYEMDHFQSNNDETDNEQIANCIESNNNGTLKLSFHIPSVYLGSIIGKQGTTKQRIEKETETVIKIPRKGKDEDVIIIGNNKDRIISCHNRIQVIVSSSRRRQEITHFVSIPLINEEIKANFQLFKSKVLDELKEIEECLFQDSNLLHLTIVVMSLMDNYEREKAIDLLKECEKEIVQPLIGNEPFHINISGLDIMNDDPSRVNILYAKVSDTNGKIQEIADKINEKFSSKGISNSSYDRVKLHATLINTIYPIKFNDKTKRKPIDCTELLNKYGSFNFGSIEVKEIHLSHRITKREDGYYRPSVIIKSN